MTRLKCTVCSVHSTVTEVATTGPHQRQAAKSTKTTPPSLVVPCGIQSRPTPLKQEDNLSGHSAPTRDGLPNELALAGITDREAANRYLREIHMPAVNAKFACPVQEQGAAFVPWIGGNLAVFHGPRKLTDPSIETGPLEPSVKRAASIGKLRRGTPDPASP